jgi:hypothetical protein
MCGYVEEAVITPQPAEAQAYQQNYQEPQVPPAQPVPPQAPPAPQGPHAQQVPPQGPHAMGEEELRNARGNATASLVCGILGCLIPFVGVVLGIIGIVLGASARKRLPDNERGMAAAGFVMGIVGTIYSVIILIIFFALIGMLMWAAAEIPSAFYDYSWMY